MLDSSERQLKEAAIIAMANGAKGTMGENMERIRLNDEVSNPDFRYFFRKDKIMKLKENHWFTKLLFVIFLLFMAWVLWTAFHATA